MLRRQSPPGQGGLHPRNHAGGGIEVKSSASSTTFAEARAIVVKHDLRPSFALYRPPGLWPSFNAEEEQAQRVIADAAAELLTTSRRELDRLSHCHAWQWVSAVT